MPSRPQALSVDLLQGLLKKIALELLLADFAFQRRNSMLRPCQFLQGGLVERPWQAASLRSALLYQPIAAAQNAGISALSV